MPIHLNHAELISIREALVSRYKGDLSSWDIGPLGLALAKINDAISKVENSRETVESFATSVI